MVDVVSSSTSQIPFINRAVNECSEQVVKGVSAGGRHLMSSLYKTLSTGFVDVFIITTLNLPKVDTLSGIKQGALTACFGNLLDPVTDKVMKAVLFPLFSKHANDSAKTVGLALTGVSKIAFSYFLTLSVCDYFEIANAPYSASSNYYVSGNLIYSFSTLAISALALKLLPENISKELKDTLKRKQ